MNRKMIGEEIYIRVSDSHETWKCADPELEKSFLAKQINDCIYIIDDLNIFPSIYANDNI